MLELIRMSSNMAVEANRKICYRVLLQKREFTPRETRKHSSNTFSST